MAYLSQYMICIQNNFQAKVSDDALCSVIRTGANVYCLYRVMTSERRQGDGVTKS